MHMLSHVEVREVGRRTGGARAATHTALRLLLVAGLLLSLALPMPGFATPTPGAVERVSLAHDGQQASGHSSVQSITDDGRYVVFTSEATNLVPGDTNGVRDVFVRDRVAGSTTRVSVSSSGTQGNAESSSAQIAGSGRYVVFDSQATNLVTGDTNGNRDIFVRDLETGATARVSRRSDTDEAHGHSWSPSISADGRWVVFASDADNMDDDDANGVRDVYLHDRNAGSTSRISWGIGGNPITQECSRPMISSDGSTVVFQSASQELVPGDDAPFVDIFAQNLNTGAREVVSIGLEGLMANGGGSESAAVSATGRYVTFRSTAFNLVEGDVNGTVDLFIRDRVLGTTERITVTPSGGEPSIGPDTATAPISADGRFVAFTSPAYDLVAGDENNERDIFLRDRTLGQTSRVSVSSKGIEARAGSFGSAMSPDGRYIAFSSAAPNLLLGDTNNRTDVFLRDLQGVYQLNATVLAGSTRFDTAVTVSEEAYPGKLDPAGARTVVIATGRNWPDALGGVALAGVLDGPVLLVDAHSVPTEVQQEIQRLEPAKAIILGGTGAVGPAVEDWLAVELGGAVNVDRIYGASRYETADLVAERVIELEGAAFGEVAFIATGGNFPDALAAAPIAAALKWPILLSHPKTGLSDGTKAVLDNVVYAAMLGGTSAVPVSVEQYLIDTLGDEYSGWERIQGNSRYATAVALAEWGNNIGALEWDGVAISTGRAFPDALAGGILQAKRPAPLLLTSSTVLSTETQAALRLYRGEIDNVTFFGGTNALTVEVRAAVVQALK